MRLGAYPCILEQNTHAHRAYDVKEISERHRHRYEFNNAYKGICTRNGMKISGTSPDGELVEIVEIEDHPWFLGASSILNSNQDLRNLTLSLRHS